MRLWCVAMGITWASACASTHAPVTWETAAPAAAARAGTTTASPLPHSGGDAKSPGPDIDSALLAFTDARAKARRLPKSSPAFAAYWQDVLTRIDSACEHAPRASDLGAFVRARATLEVEYDNDMRRGVLLPSDLRERLERVLMAVDESVGELRLANAPGTLAPRPRLEGELVLKSPVSPLILSSPFGVRSDPITGHARFHAGCDLDSPTGTSVYASASGLVVFAGMQGGHGKHVVVDHGDAIRTHYSHLSEIWVEPGMMVEEGHVVGLVGSTGRSTGPHLHFAVTDAAGEFLDPMALLDVPFANMTGQVKTSDGRKKLRDDRLPLRLHGDTIEIVAR